MEISVHVYKVLQVPIHCCYMLQKSLSCDFIGYPGGYEEELSFVEESINSKLCV